MSKIHVGDVIRDGLGLDRALILGHHLSDAGTPIAWRAVFFPMDPELGDPFETWYPYDMAERDAATPGAHLQWWQAEGCP